MVKIEPILLIISLKKRTKYFQNTIYMLASDEASTAETETKTGVQSERELILLCQQGDRDSFRLLYQRYQYRVRSTLYQLCGKSCLDDLVQEVFLRAWKGLPKLKTAKYFSTWLYRISWNVATDRRRKLAKGQEKISLNVNEKYVDKDRLNYGKDLSNAQDTPNLMHLHYQDLVQRGLNNLSFEHRAVLVLHDLEDIPQKQVAEILDIPVGTVKSRLYHARNSFKKFLEKQGISL